MTLFLGGLFLFAQTPDQKEAERQRVRENIHRLRLLRLTEALDLSEEQAAKVCPVASRLEEGKVGILKSIDGEMDVLRDLLEEKSPDEARLEQNLSPVQWTKYVVFSAEFYMQLAAGLKRGREQTRARQQS